MNTMETSLFLISNEDNDKHVVLFAKNREFAKSKASQYLGKDPDRYVVTPLLTGGPRKVFFDISTEIK